jgi:predicted amidohydrolase YtcJ
MERLTLINAHVITMDPGSPIASGLVIENGLISRLLTGPEGYEKPVKGKSLNMGGRTILPGLIDSHLHLQKYAASLAMIDCETNTMAECLTRVTRITASAQPGTWILGHGWNHNLWTDGYGSSSDLDKIAPDNPVYLTGKSLHVSWANSQALDLAGIGESTPDPPGGAIQRDEDGQPTGILFEDAVKLIESIIPTQSVEKTAGDIQNAQESLWRYGLTGVHDFDRELCILALQHLNKEKRLHLRVQKSVPSEYLDQAIEAGYQTGEGDEWLWFGGVKEFMDGALGPQTAAMLRPYEDTPETGMLLKTEEEIYQLGIKAAKNGLAVSIHAIGDLANRTLINALERIRKFEKRMGIPPLPHRIEHVQLIDSDDLPRMAELRIIASMQPIHATSDLEMADRYWGKRTALAYAPKPQFDQGTLVIFGSDAPVELPDPWQGIHAAVTRQRQDGSPAVDGWHPENRVSLEQALQAYTVNPAKAGMKENLQGKLSPGSWADLIALDINPISCPTNEIPQIRPCGTMVSGNWVHKEF